MKVVRRLVGPAVVAALAMGPATSAEAVPIYSGSCKVDLQAGQFGSSAFAKIKLAPGAGCHPGTGVGVEGRRAGQPVYGPWCDLWQPTAQCMAGGGWLQSTRANASYVAAHVTLCGPACVARVYPGPRG